jgi:hypothetical protein
MKRRLPVILIIALFSSGLRSQPFADILNFNYQAFGSSYADSIARHNRTDDYFLNLFLPKEFKSGHTLLVRLNTEMLSSTIGPDSAYTSKLYAISLPLGMKFISKNKKWETIVMGIPKIASDMEDRLDVYDVQYGGIFLEQFAKKPKLKFKLGLYYNREAFGNFFMPLAGIDWKINNRICMYGILPTSYKLEFNLINNRLYTGLNLKYFTRSFRLSQWDGHDYVRYNEGQVKLFIDCFVAPKLLLFAEAGYTVNENPLQHRCNTNDRGRESIGWNNPVYTPLDNYPILSVGLAYRVRFDLDKEEPAREQ